MPIASSSRVGTYWVAESTYAVTPTDPDIQTLRLTPGGDGLVKAQQVVQSEEIDATRTVTDQVVVGYNANFAFNQEISAGGAYDSFWAATLGGTPVTVNMTATTISFANGDNSVNDSANGFVTAGVVARMWIRVTGTLNNNGLMLVSTVAAGKLVILRFLKVVGTTVTSTTITTETAGSSFTIKAKMCRTGVTNQTSYSIEENFSDLSTTYQRGIGFRPTEFQIGVTAKQKLSGSCRFLGRDVTTETTSMKGSGAIISADTASVLNGTTNVPAILYNDAVLTTRVRSAQFTVNGNVTEADAISYPAAAELVDGTFAIGGPVEAYFENTDLISDVLAHNAVSTAIPFRDSSNNWLVLSSHRGYYTGQIRKQGQNQPVLQALTFAAVRHVDSDNSMFQMDMIHA